MKRIGSFPAQLLITALLSTALAFAIPGFVDRHEYGKAVVDHVKNPNSENDATLKAERAKNQRLALRTNLVVAGVLFVGMNAGCFVARRWPRESSKTPA